MNPGRGRRARALTLVELLLAITIIGILAGLVAGVAAKARERARETAWALEAGSFLHEIRERLASYYDGMTDYPAWTAVELHQRGILDNKDMDFLGKRGVTYSPFSSSDPDEKYVIQARIRFSGRVSNMGFRKREITRPQDFPY